LGGWGKSQDRGPEAARGERGSGPAKKGEGRKKQRRNEWRFCRSSERNRASDRDTKSDKKSHGVKSDCAKKQRRRKSMGKAYKKRWALKGISRQQKGGIPASMKPTG